MGTQLADIVSSKIEGVNVLPLKELKAIEGSVLHFLRSDSPYFESFGEVYLSSIIKDSVKAWKRHIKMTQNLIVPVGEVKFVLFDRRENSPTYGRVQQVSLSREKFCLLQIPPMIWYGFQGVGDQESLIVNCASHVHDPEEVERLPKDATVIPYHW